MDKQFRLLLIPILLFIGFFLTEGYLNRFASDDFEFLSKYQELGFTGSVAYFYHHWNTRWLAIGFMNFVFKGTSIAGSLLWYHCLSIALLWFALYRVCAAILSTSTSQLLVVSGYGMVCFFYSCFSIPDVFFWVNTSTMYLFGTVAFLFAISELIYKQHSFLSYLVLICSGFYLGGAYEPLVFTSMVGVVLFLFYKFKQNGPIALKQPSVLKSIIFVSVLMIAFAISYAGEGHVIRASFLPQTTVGFKLWVLVKAIIKMLVIYLPLKLLIAIPFSLPWFLIGMQKSFKPVSGKLVIVAAITLLALVVISMAPIAFLMSEMGPERAWTQVSVFITFFAAFLAAWLGSNYGRKIENMKSVSVMILILCFFITGSGVLAVRQDLLYSKAFDERMKLLSSFKYEGKTGTVSLSSLPSTTWLHSSEISEDSAHFTNMHLKNYLQLGFDIKKENDAVTAK